MKWFRVAAIVALAGATLMLPTPVSAQPATGQAAGSTAAATGASDAGTAASARSVEVAALSDCPVNHACLWQHANYTGFMLAIPDGSWHPDFTKIPCGGCSNGDFNDDASSWYNRAPRNYCVSVGIHGGNPDNTMPVGTRGNFTSGWNDGISSIGFIGCP